MSIIKYSDIIAPDGSIEQFIAQIKESEREVLKLSKTIQSSLGSLNVNSSQEEFAAVNRQIDQQNGRVKTLTQSKKMLTLVQQEEAKLLKREARDRAFSDAALNKQRLNTAKAAEQKRKLNAEARKEARETLKITGAYDKLNNSLRQARERYRNLLVSLGKTAGPTIRARAEFLKLEKRVRAVDNATLQFQRNVGNYPRQVQFARNAFVQLAAGLGVVGGAFGAIQVARNATSILRDFETQLVRVGKTSNIEGPELERLGRAFIDLSTTDLSGIRSSRLLEIAEVAGQLGVEGVDSITNFSEALARLEISSDISGTEGAQQIARILNITDEDFDTVDRLASSVVQLGNTFATSESQIVSNSLEIAKGLAAFDVSSEQVVGLGAAIRSLAIQPEVAGSAFQRAFFEIDSAVRQGGDALQDLSRITDQTQEEVRRSFRESPVRFFEDFLRGLSSIKEEGGDVVSELANLGISQARYTRTLIPAIKRVDEVTRALDSSSKAYDENTANIIESNRQLETLDSAIIGLTSSWEKYILELDDTTKASELLKNSIVVLSENLATILNTLGFVVAGLAVYKGAQLLGTTATIAATVAQNAYALAFNRTSERAKQASASVRAFAAASKTTLIGLGIAVLLAIATRWRAIGAAIRGTTERAIEFRKEANKTAEAQIRLVSGLRDVERGSEEYNRIIEEINLNYKGLLDNIDKEATSLEQLNSILEKVNQNREVEIATSDARASIEALEEELRKINAEIDEEITSSDRLDSFGSALTNAQIAALTDINRREELLTIAQSVGGFPSQGLLDQADRRLQEQFGVSLNDQGVRELLDDIDGFLGDRASLFLDYTNRIEAFERQIQETTERIVDLQDARDNSGLPTDVLGRAQGTGRPVTGGGESNTVDTTEFENIKEIREQIRELQRQIDEDVNTSLRAGLDPSEIEREIRLRQDKIKELQDRINALLGEVKNSAQKAGRDIQSALDGLLIEEQRNLSNTEGRISEDDGVSLSARLQSLRDQFAAEARILEIRNEARLRDENLTAKEIELINSNFRAKLLELDRRYFDEVGKLVEEDKKNQIERINEIRGAEIELNNTRLLFLDRDINELQEQLLNARGSRREAIESQISRLIEERRATEKANAILRSEQQAEGLTNSDEDAAKRKIIAEQLLQELTAIDLKFDDILDDLNVGPDTEPWERWRNIAEGAIDGIIDRIGRLQQREVDLAQSRIQETDRAISFQEQRAANGLQNTLAFERRERAKAEEELQRQQRRLERLEKARAFFSLLRANTNSLSEEENAGTAVADTIIQFGIAEAFTQGFYKGGYTGDQGINQASGIVHGQEFVIDHEGTKALGLKGKDMSYFKREFIDKPKSSLTINQIKGERTAIERTPSPFNTKPLESKMDSVVKAIKSIPKDEVDIERISESVIELTRKRTIGRNVYRNKTRKKL